MYVYHSMSGISWLTAFSVLLIIWANTLRAPWHAVISLFRQLIKARHLLWLLLLTVGVLLLNKYELLLENHLSYDMDFTPWILKLEGHFVASFQSLFHDPAVTEVAGFFYLVVFQALILASLGIYASDNRLPMFYATCCTVILNYLVAIPFYLLFPVNEVWSYAPSGASFYMLEVFPQFEQVYRPLSGLNNCFPSLHTSVSVSMAILAMRSGNRRWGWFAAVCSAIILFSIFYLGIHWLTDMLGGSVLAVSASYFGLAWGKRLANTSRPESLNPHQAIKKSL
ncbi:phosphatase PAP2 family protein [Paenibacillus rubinfantis]|uniref:phosphatase PAP2 family protein n=1 Tax=Paenibacillus rubinfantis TaxID=1720296 RepID=UPI00073E7DF4|nr:phosphatase PAP2 family protein [Paenibacillus rubinfantis]